MREIKFRAWNGKAMYYLDMLYNIELTYTKAGSWCLWDIWTHKLIAGEYDEPELILMQYTGLKDRNGKEIYEGDIVQDQDGNLYQVKYTKYYIYPFGAIFPDKPKEVVNEYECEIIGNIYENPELLEE